MGMTRPLFVLISDVHYSLNTLDLADTSFRHALAKAKELGIPLIDAGDITNDKAILRAEVMNALLDTMKGAKVPVYLLVGNHSLINEKGKEHALNFLSPYVSIIDNPTTIKIYDTNVHFIPYQSDPEKFKEFLNLTPNNGILVLHQGVQGAFMGDYIQDKSAVTPELFNKRIVFSGHYHRAQTVGPVTYIGNPYSLSFGEANDGPKGYLIVNEDGSYIQEILHLRQHIVEEMTLEEFNDSLEWKSNPFNLLWIKIRGKSSELKHLSKQIVSDKLVGHDNFRLDLIPDENHEKITYTTIDSAAILDQVIMNLQETDEQKNKLKQLWRNLI